LTAVVQALIALTYECT